MLEETKNFLDELNYLPPCSIWNTENKGEFNIIKLMKNWGILKETNLELAIKSWQDIENRGAIVVSCTEGLENRQDLPNIQEQKQRNEIYQSLVRIFDSNLSDIQAFSISCNYSTADWYETSEFIDFDISEFSLSLIIGRTVDNKWLCLCPTFPNEINYYRNIKIKSLDKPLEQSNKVQVEIQKLLEQLRPIQIYGYFGGGYDYSYQHQIICHVADEQLQTLEKTLRLSNMLNLVIFDGKNEDKLFDWETLAFFDENTSDIKIYLLSFWCIADYYLVGKLITNDWLFSSSGTRMSYNP